ncbi:NAD-dependent epimerase [Naegleria gruberi]|uniref:NAD-dependent epimerase n=1 Tax=Naegleria gruberi TaxID=5762 RepID=D2VUY7_NAEGR|nr:NAD-dependent epimerase [Naegleria gruberi]EFC39401.1 NAD-dependent epimerase [Naegleria gruberi]|eukprot:XP_002672145.1 NAD-dependent epimerase [Naegleria gruberi strain NEG-M]
MSHRHYYYSKSTILLKFSSSWKMMTIMMMFAIVLMMCAGNAHSEVVVASTTSNSNTASGLSVASVAASVDGSIVSGSASTNMTSSGESDNTVGLSQSSHSRKVLVTGSAGFIGFHLAEKLAKEEFAYWNNFMATLVNETKGNIEQIDLALNNVERSVMIGLDNFNDYYSTDLKYMRKKQLEKTVREINQNLIEQASTILRKEEADIKPFIDFQVIEGDVCNTSILSEIFEKYTFTHVLHLAAQAGVRYSLKNPQTYIRNNILCQIELLETSVKYQKTNPPVFAYASSSSVYGNIQEFDPSAFHEQMNINKPTNVYSASKISQELFAETYNYLYGIPVIGLRFFTVYGPYGRPDMALFSWVDQIVKGKPITLYTLEGKELMRDFTYIDDIVNGIINSMNYGDRVKREEGRAVHDVFNLGNHTPEKVTDMIKYIEKALDKKAKINHVKKPPTDMTITFADITHSQELLNFQPKTKLEDGVRKFVDWYLKYYHFSNNQVTDDVIFTTYFVTKGHPERDEQYGDSCFEPMREWYESVHKHNLRAVVFYDDAKLYTKCGFNKLTSYNVRFELVQLGERSTNDERFFIYENFLLQAQRESTKGLSLLPKRVIMTDLFDIKFNKNPFEYLSTFDECDGDVCESTDKLFFGSEPTTIGSSKWAQQKLAQCSITIDEVNGSFYYNKSAPYPLNTLSKHQTPLNSMLLNPGIVGGNVEVVMNMLAIYNQFMRASPVQSNCNTPVFNILMYQHEAFQAERNENGLSSLLVTGQPLHTIFKAFDESDQYYIKHK